MQANITKWGNSQGIVIPKSLMEMCNLQVNEPVDLEVRNGKIIIQNVHRHRTLEERSAEYGGRLGPFESYDWGEPQGREVW